MVGAAGRWDREAVGLRLVPPRELESPDAAALPRLQGHRMRRQSVAFFLGDVGFLSDPKFRKLARRLTEPDDFNSAVGAYFIALAAARRNGLPMIDVDAETDSRFIPDLMAVGLLIDGGFPEKAFVGWAPSRQPRPSEIASNASSGVEMVERAENVIPSTPLLSIPIREEDRASEPLTRAIDYIEGRSGRAWQFRPGSSVWDTLEADLRDFGVDAVLSAMTLLDGHRLDHGQLVFGATRRLHPIASAPTNTGKDERAAEEERAHRARLERTQRELAAYRGEAS